MNAMMLSIVESLRWKHFIGYPIHQVESPDKIFTKYSREHDVRRIKEE